MKQKLILAATLAITTSWAVAQNIATVNGQGIPKSLEDEWISQFVENGGQDTAEARERVRESLISASIIEQEALKRGLDKSAKVKFGLQYARLRILQEALLENEITKNPVSDAQVQERYQLEKAMMGPHKYEVRHILVKTEKEAQELLARLQKGEDFEKLAKERSIDTDAKNNGGYLGWSSASTYVKPFGDALRTLKKGEVTKTPVKSEFGYHLIRVEDVRDVQFPSLDEVKARIKEGLTEQKQKQYLEKLIASAKIEVPETKKALTKD